MRSLTIFFFLFINFVQHSTAQKIAGFVVDLPNGNILDVPVSLHLDALTSLPDSTILLIEITGAKRVPVPYQIENSSQRILHFLIPQSSSDTKKRSFELIRGKPAGVEKKVWVENSDGALTITSSGKNLLRYNYKLVYPASGVDTIFKRSGFIHPLYAPHGQELTRVSPPDHYHHFGLWNPWTKVLVGTDTIDFWNLSTKKGFVRFAKTISVSEGPVYADYQVLHEHVAFINGQEIIAINELQTVRIFNSGAGDYYIADITIQLDCLPGRRVVLKEYRYGGLGWRATEKWDKTNSETLTSEGKTRKDADGSKARWCIVQGSLDNDYGGVVMMSYPTNYNFPEPLRIWPESMNGRGDVFANFSPTKDKDWELTSGKHHVLRYRLLVFNGKFSSVKAEAAWKHFASGPGIIIRNKTSR